MPTLAALRMALGLEAGGPDATFQGSAEALHLLAGSGRPEAQVRAAALSLIARELSGVSGLGSLLEAFAATLHSSRPERELVGLLFTLTGEHAELRASWGDPVASSGQLGPVTELPLVYEGRRLGVLSLSSSARWRYLQPLASEYAVLARLQSAAAGAARRRVGERSFEALLSGELKLPDGEFGPCAVAALGLDAPPPRSERAQDARLKLQDTLAGVGEGYFHERGLTCLTLCRADQVLWLWHSLDPGREARELCAALNAASPQDFRLGVSGRHAAPDEVKGALREARQAMTGTREARGYTVFSSLDPLTSLQGSEALTVLREQLAQRLAPQDPDGKLAHTLRAYLQHRGSLSALAGALNLHPNTLRYRLRRVEEALNERLSDPASLARLYLAFGGV